jgi:hypothetical protein
MQVAVCWPQDPKEVIKEKWIQYENGDLIQCFNALDTGKQTLGKTYQVKIFRSDNIEKVGINRKIIKEFYSNVHFTNDLSLFPGREDWDNLVVFKYPVFKPTWLQSYYGDPKSREANKHRKRLKVVCELYRKVIIDRKNTHLYQVTGKRPALDGDFVIYKQDNHILMEHNPGMAKKLRAHPERLADHVHVRGRLRATEIMRAMYAIQADIENHRKIRDVCCRMDFWIVGKPKDQKAAKTIERLIDLNIHIYGYRHYRKMPAFKEFITGPAAEALYWYNRRKPVLFKWQRDFFSFIKKELFYRFQRLYEKTERS